MSRQLDSARASEAQRPASPFRLNLEQQHKRAKDLLKGLRAGEADALRRFHRHHPGMSNASGSAPPDGIAQLSEAQLVIARELGLPSWPRLKAHVEAMDRSWTGICRGEAAADRCMTTLHVRCGSDIRLSLKQAGFIGDFLEYSDPFCRGPVVAESGWLDRRVDFLSQTYGWGSGMSRDQINENLHRTEEELRSAPSRYERIALWFEHDSYDQLILARCLSRFADHLPTRLELISPGRYPGGMRFIGLGQLPPEALRLLWEERSSVVAETLRAGREAWDALRSSDPRTLAALATKGTESIPQLGQALRRHCQELPWTGDGLGLTERLILQLLAEEARTAGQVFSRLMLEREPLPWMSDLIFRDILEGMRHVEQPVFTGVFDGEDHRWPTERLTIIQLGRAVLLGKVDWLSLRPPARWVGGALISGAAPCWRWDDTTASAVNC
jgi:hypothetical protein